MEYFDWFVTMAKFTCSWSMKVNSKRRKEWFIPIRVELVTHNIKRNGSIMLWRNDMSAFFDFEAREFELLKITTKMRKTSKKLFSRAQKYFTYQASCEGEREYGWLLAKHTIVGCFEMIGKFWKSIWVFRRQIQMFLREGLLTWRGTCPAPLQERQGRANDKCGWVDTSTICMACSDILLIIFSLYLICPQACQQTCFKYRQQTFF